ncbi:MAG: hypothetical protein JXR96_03660 [Deltaproteobacteria bacterium]|nr:hypothetical protein [Deltaproteobacteria bacterium]
MRRLRIAPFGIRGFVGESLSPQLAIDFTSAFATYVDGDRVLLARDTRHSSPMLQAAVCSALVGAGCEVLDLGICPTPVAQFLVPHFGAAGAVCISGGHNSMGWNAVTLVGSDGAYLDPVGGEAVLDFFHARDFIRRDFLGMGSLSAPADFQAPYWKALEAQLDVERIRGAGLTVLVDPVGGAGCDYLEPFARTLGLQLVPMNARKSGYLAREPEPRPRSAEPMASLIRHAGGDVGFVLSSDMGRMSIVTEAAEPISEEYGIAVVADHALGSRCRGRDEPVLVTNTCTTMSLDEIARCRGARVVKTEVGQAWIMAAVADEGAVLAGEGSGSAALPAFSRAFDGFLMMGLVLEAMAARPCRASELLQAVPRYAIVKRSLACSSVEAYQALDALAEHYAGSQGRLDMTDGLRVDWQDGWVHARMSRTEQVLRVLSESRDTRLAEQRALEVLRLLEREI